MCRFVLLNSLWPLLQYKDGICASFPKFLSFCICNMYYSFNVCAIVTPDHIYWHIREECCRLGSGLILESRRKRKGAAAMATWWEFLHGDALCSKQIGLRKGARGGPSGSLLTHTEASLRGRGQFLANCMIWGACVKGKRGSLGNLRSTYIKPLNHDSSGCMFEGKNAFSPLKCSFLGQYDQKSTPWKAVIFTLITADVTVIFLYIY